LSFKRKKIKLKIVLWILPESEASISSIYMQDSGIQPNVAVTPKTDLRHSESEYENDVGTLAD
jgi:hypothetical protein